MTDFNFTDVFAELTEAYEAEEKFLQTLAGLMPTSGLLLLLPTTETRLVAGLDFALARELEQALVAELSQAATGAVAARQVAGAWIYALSVERFAGILLWTIPGTVDLSREPAGPRLLGGFLDYALQNQQHREFSAQDSQYRRQIEVLRQQHHQLIDDNYRQYQLHQEKEQKYARRLESEIARQTAQLREANAHLELSNRLKSEFLANMSHELRTPMNAIIGYTELLTETALSGEQREYCQTIGQSAAALLALINDILDLAKIEAGRLDLEIIPFDLAELLKGLSAMFALSVRSKGLELLVHRDRDLPTLLLGDSHRLRQVLINLLSNAVKFTPKGTIELRVEAVSVGERWANDKNSAAPGPVALRFTVKDSGIGIPAQRLSAVFEKFTQVDGSITRRFGGTGLGLSISRQLVELMGGQIEVSSQEGKGSVFSFVITLAESPPLSVIPAAMESGPAPVAELTGGAEAKIANDTGPRAGIGRARILLVEDNVVNQKLVSLMIAKQGYELVVAADGLEALECLRQEEFALVLMDMQMPRMDGLSATREIRAIEREAERRREFVALARPRLSSIPIVGLTANARKEDEEACFAAGMNAFLTKPISKNKLIATLAAIIGES